VHRQLTAALAGVETPPIDNAELDDIAKNCNDCKAAADGAQDESSQLFLCMLIKDYYEGKPIGRPGHPLTAQPTVPAVTDALPAAASSSSSSTTASKKAKAQVAPWLEDAVVIDCTEKWIMVYVMSFGIDQRLFPEDMPGFVQTDFHEKKHRHCITYRPGAPIPVRNRNHRASSNGKGSQRSGRGDGKGKEQEKAARGGRRDGRASKDAHDKQGQSEEVDEHTVEALLPKQSDAELTKEYGPQRTITLRPFEMIRIQMGVDPNKRPMEVKFSFHSLQSDELDTAKQGASA
jgi:hypothetical protein